MDGPAFPQDTGRIVQVSISDTGVGIPEDKLELIFEPFRQASEGHTREYEGTGLGLSLARRMVSLLGGAIEVESEVGKGSIFKVNLCEVQI